MSSINIIIVDDVKMTRVGLSFLLKQNMDFNIIGEAENGRYFVQMLSQYNPDIVLMDINMPLLNGIDATKEALSIRPDLKIIALTNDDGEQFIAEMTDAGAKGFLMKSVEQNELRKAIITVHNGGTYIAPDLISYLNKSRISAHVRSDLQLTALEKNVLELLCKGMSIAEVSNHLFIEKSVVEKQIEYLSQKTKTRNAVGLVLFAIKHKLVKIM